MIFSWLFKKTRETQSTSNKEMHEILRNSFSNVKKDISKLHSYINEVKEKHKEYETTLNEVLSRLEIIESHLGFTNLLPEIRIQKSRQEETVSGDSSIEPSIEPVFPGLWESLTETEQKICWKLAHIQNELPNQWITLKYLAQEIYPDKEYSKVRSTLSQYITNLEELGLIKRKRSGRQAYVYLTKGKHFAKQKVTIKKEVKK